MKYLKYFEEVSAYETYKNGSEFILPNVSFVEEINSVNFNPYVVPTNPNIVAVYNITDISRETHIIGSYGIGNVAYLIIDGNEVEPDTYYQFENTGLHTVEIVLEDKTTMSNMFEYCDELVSFTIPDSITEIWQDICYDCKNLTNVSIGSGVTYIQDNIFNPNVTITISNNNTAYDNRENCNCIIETATNTLIEGFNNSFIPDSVTSIGQNAFSQCSSLTSINIPNSVTTIGNSAFYGCSSLTSIEIPDSVTSIEANAFNNCSSLASIKIPNSVTAINHRVFENCSSLTSIEIPNSVTTISSYAFDDCKNLTSVIIPESVTTMGHGIFTNCSKLNRITCYATSAPIFIDNPTGTGWNMLGLYGLPSDGILRVPSGSDYSFWMNPSPYKGLSNLNWTIEYI